MGGAAPSGGGNPGGPEGIEGHEPRTRRFEGSAGTAQVRAAGVPPSDPLGATELSAGGRKRDRSADGEVGAPRARALQGPRPGPRAVILG